MECKIVLSHLILGEKPKLKADKASTLQGENQIKSTQYIEKNSILMDVTASKFN